MRCGTGDLCCAEGRTQLFCVAKLDFSCFKKQEFHGLMWEFPFLMVKWASYSEDAAIRQFSGYLIRALLLERPIFVNINPPEGKGAINMQLIIDIITIDACFSFSVSPII